MPGTSAPGAFRVGVVSYKTLAEALAAVNDGGTVIGKPGTYSRQAGIVARRGVKLIGDGGLVHLAAQGDSAEGKGTLVVRGANCTVENFEFSGATVSDGNGAGIRLESPGLLLRRCSFHDNQNGVLTGKIADCDVLMERCEFARNGTGDGRTHNFYIGQIRKLTMLGCYSKQALAGHLGKSRAAQNLIVACRFTDEGGSASYELEFPSGGMADVRGCIFEQSSTTGNNTMISFGAEKNVLNAQHEFRFYQNTMVNRADNGPMILLATAPALQDIIDNVFAGRGAPSDTGNRVVPLAALVDADHFDFRLKLPSEGSHRWAEAEYVYPANTRPRRDQLQGAFAADAVKPAVVAAAAPAQVKRSREKVTRERPRAGEEAQWWAALPADTWVEVNKTRLDSVQPNPVPPGATGTEGVVSGWSGAAYDEQKNRLLIFGGGHNDSADNSVYELAVDTLAWSRLSDPSPRDTLPPASLFNWNAWDKNKDGKPTARHTYWGLVYRQGKLVVVAGVHSWTFDTVAGKWQEMAARPGGAYLFCPAVFDPVTDRIYAGSADWELEEITPESMASVKRHPTNAGGHNENGMQCCQVEREFWVLRGAFDGYAFNLDTKQVRRLQINAEPSTFWWSGCQYVKGLGMVRWENTDPGNARDGQGAALGGRLFVVDPKTLKQREYPLAGVPAYAPQNGMLGRFRYLPKYKALVLVTHAGRNVHVLRLA